MNLIRLHQPVSRVQLSTLTGIYRSNISFIVEEMVEEGLVREERGSSARGRGRVPILLSLNPDGFRVLGVSIRVTATVVTLADLTGKALDSSTFCTPDSPDAWVQLFRKSMRRLCKPFGVQPNILKAVTAAKPSRQQTPRQQPRCALLLQIIR